MTVHHSIFIRPIASIFCASLLPLAAAETANTDPVPVSTPPVEKLTNGMLRIGEITADPKTREIRIPTKVNLDDELLEFVLVHQDGKIHESLLTTTASPLHLNLAFKLLRYTASPELYVIQHEAGVSSGEFPMVPEETKSAARIVIEVVWKEGERIRKVSVNDWIQHSVKGSAMPPGPWVYGGSSVYEGTYLPESTGDMIAIFLSKSSIINYPGNDNHDDTVWWPFPKRVPEPGTDVTLLISPNPKTETK